MIKSAMLGNWQWIDYEKVESTNDEAVRLSQRCEDGARFVITAQVQTKGRGRHGRTWIGLSGNLFMSLLLHWPPQNNSALVLISGLALLKTVKELSPIADVKLKWPNDVLLSGKKVSGILLETTSDDCMVVGIGVNIADYPKDNELLYKATSLREQGINCDRLEFVQKYLDQLDNLCLICQNKGLAEISKLWQEFAFGINQPIIIRMPKQEQKGIFRGLDSHGMLLLEKADGIIITISAGDVFFAKDDIEG